MDVIRPAALQNFRHQQAKRTANVNAKLAKAGQIAAPIPVGVLVMIKNITRSSKHEPIWLGPFRVVRQTQGGTYVLQDNDFTLYHRNPPRDQIKVIRSDNGVNMEDIYTVEKVLSHRGNGKRRQYLVKWLNYPASDNTWEPEVNLDNCAEALEDYWKSYNAQAKLREK